MHVRLSQTEDDAVHIKSGGHTDLFLVCRI
jgi:hypothetical protein